jgi:hypothetical protein
MQFGRFIHEFVSFCFFLVHLGLFTIQGFVRNSYILSYNKMSHAMALPGRERLFDRDSENLMIIRDDWAYAASSFGVSRSSLQSAHDIFQSVIKIVKPEYGMLLIRIH